MIEILKYAAISGGLAALFTALFAWLSKIKTDAQYKAKAEVYTAAVESERRRTEEKLKEIKENAKNKIKKLDPSDVDDISRRLDDAAKRLRAKYDK